VRLGWIFTVQYFWHSFDAYVFTYLISWTVMLLAVIGYYASGRWKSYWDRDISIEVKGEN